MRIVVAGDGRMGCAVADAARAAGAAFEVLDVLGRAALAQPPALLAARFAGADAVVDFTTAEQAPRTVTAAARAGIAAVVGTTGRAPEDLGLERVAAAGRAAVFGPNFSLGVHVTLALAREAARLAERVGGLDVGIVETHHRRKRDHPSGTAIALAEAVLGAQAGKARWAPAPAAGPPDPDTLYVASVRTGAVPGTHVLSFDGPRERIEIRHEARDRRAFAEGALRAAAWTAGRRGVFTFEEVARDLLGLEGGEGC